MNEIIEFDPMYGYEKKRKKTEEEKVYKYWSREEIKESFERYMKNTLNKHYD